MPATATPDLFAGPELTNAERSALVDYCAVMAEANELDADTADYVGLTPDHPLANCGGAGGRIGCGRLLLAANLPGEPPRGYRVTDGDSLPPLVFRRVPHRGRRVAQCCSCYVAERRAHRGTA